jgi:hypothetical protein
VLVQCVARIRRPRHLALNITYGKSDQPKAPWLVTCSCGWGRECSSAWAAESVSKLHQQLGDVGVEHVTHVEIPDNLKDGQQLPLV